MALLATRIAESDSYKHWKIFKTQKKRSPEDGRAKRQGEQKRRKICHVASHVATGGGNFFRGRTVSAHLFLRLHDSRRGLQSYLWEDESSER